MRITSEILISSILSSLVKGGFMGDSCQTNADCFNFEFGACCTRTYGQCSDSSGFYTIIEGEYEWLKENDCLAMGE